MLDLMGLFGYQRRITLLEWKMQEKDEGEARLSF